MLNCGMQDMISLKLMRVENMSIFKYLKKTSKFAFISVSPMNC